MKKYAHGGHVKHEGHPHEKQDKHLAKEIEHEAKEIERHHEGHKHGGKVHHRIDGGPVGRLGRGRRGGKGATRVAVNVLGKPGGDGGAPMMPPPALGSGPSAMPPRPVMPPPGPAGMPPRPGMAGPMRHGGHVKKHEHERYHGHEHHHSKKVHKHQAR